METVKSSVASELYKELGIILADWAANLLIMCLYAVLGTEDHTHIPRAEVIHLSDTTPRATPMMGAMWLLVCAVRTSSQFH